MPVNEDISESAFAKAPRSNHNPHGPSRRGPASLPSPDDVGEWIVETEVGELEGRQNGRPPHRTPGAQKKATPKNGHPRNIAERD